MMYLTPKFPRLKKQITMNFEKYEIPVEDLDEYEKKVMDAESLLQILEVIYDMFKKLMSTVKVNKGKNNKSTTVSPTNYFWSWERGNVF
jgi:hypothetical protein